MNRKLCEIKDHVPIQIFDNNRKTMGPIYPMLMSDTLIFRILNSRPAPPHFYAVNPDNHNEKILLTKENYKKTTEELFGKKVTQTIEPDVIKVTAERTLSETTPVIENDDNIEEPETQDDELQLPDTMDDVVEDKVEDDSEIESSEIQIEESDTEVKDIPDKEEESDENKNSTSNGVVGISSIASNNKQYNNKNKKKNRNK